MSFDNIKLEKGLYTAGKGFTASLEELDPSENYKGTAYEGLDAYQRQLKRFDIKVTGRDSDTVSKFFQTSDSAALFPEYVSRAVRQGMTAENSLEKLIATTTEIDSLDYRAITADSDDASLEPADVLEGAFIPETVIKTKESLTPLKKRGRMLVASYEAIKFQKLDIFTIMLAQIGKAIADAEMADIIDTVLSSPIETITAADITNVTYPELIKLWSAFYPYNPTAMVCNTEMLSQLLNMPEFRDSAAGLSFHANGSLITPFGTEIVRVGNDKLASGILALDKNYAVEKVQAGGIVTDYDKLIDRQLERAVISSISGFSTIFTDAAKLLN